MSRLHEAAIKDDIEGVENYLELGDKINDLSRIALTRRDLAIRTTPLHCAVFSGSTKTVQFLIRQGAKLDIKDETGTTPIEYAINKRYYAIAKLLKEAGARDDNELLEQAISLELVRAIQYNSSRLVKALHEIGVLTTNTGEQALVHAAKSNSLAVAKALLECGVSPDACHGEDTALSMAAQSGHYDLVELLLKHHAEVNKYSATAQNPQESTPLIKALIHNSTEDRPDNSRLIALLLSHGAQIEKISANGLLNLAQYGKAEEIELLLQHGLNSDSLVGSTPLLDLCLQYQRFDLAKKLIDHGANVHYIDEEGKSYLHKSNDTELTKLLLAHGLKIEQEDKHKKTAIESVTNPKVAELLASLGASINKLKMTSHVVLSSPYLVNRIVDEEQFHMKVPDRYGRGPLFQLARGASLRQYLETLSILLTKNIDVGINNADSSGQTALHYAFIENQSFFNDNKTKKTVDTELTESQYTQAIDLLIARGAEPLKDNKGRTPLMCSIRQGFSASFNLRLINRYYQFEAKYYQIDPEEYKNRLIKLHQTAYPLTQLASIPGACMSHYLEMLSELLTSGFEAYINEVSSEESDDSYDETVLHYAFRALVHNSRKASEYAKAIDFLIAHGAKPLKDDLDQTPLLSALRSGSNRRFNEKILDKYYQFEANYYQIDPEEYKNLLIINSSNNSFDRQSVEKYGDTTFEFFSSDDESEMEHIKDDDDNYSNSPERKM